MIELTDKLLTSLIVKYIYKDSLFVFKQNLFWDITYVMVWDLDYQWQGKAEKITEFIQIGKGEAFTLIRPLLLITPPKIIWMDKRELADFLNEEVDKKKYYLKRLANRLEKEMKAYLEGGSVYVNNQDSKDSSLVWVKIPRKWVWLADLLSKPSEKDDSDTGK